MILGRGLSVSIDERLRTLGRVMVLLTVFTLTVITEQPDAFADSIRNREWFLGSLDITNAHTYSEGQGVVVAVIDTGVDPAHVDLVGSVLSGTDFASPPGNGHTDTGGHGTSMAGLISGHGHGDGKLDGILGVSPGSKILPVRVSTNGIFASSDLAMGIRWAVSHHVQVICIALAEVDGSPQLERAVAAAEQADVVVVAGVGNLPGPTGVEFPAAYPGVIAAAGTDEKGRHAAVSVTGPQVVLSAPATNIVSTYKNGGYGVGTGTSGATAIIAGAAALVRAKFPKLSAAEVVHRLTATAIDKGPPGRDDEYGYGIVNLVGALTATVPPLTASPSATPDLSPQPSASAGHSSRTVGWLPFAAGAIALLIVIAIWTTARRSAR